MTRGLIDDACCASSLEDANKIQLNKSKLQLWKSTSYLLTSRELGHTEKSNAEHAGGCRYSALLDCLLLHNSLEHFVQLPRQLLCKVVL